MIIIISIYHIHKDNYYIVTYLSMILKSTDSAKNSDEYSENRDQPTWI